MIAVCTIKAEPHYRREAFEKGLKAAGYKLYESNRPTRPASREDLLVMWNRQGGAEATANTWEHCGGTVIVVENGYIGRDALGRQFYAIAAHGHNGSGWFPVGDEDRWAALGIDLAPWRQTGYDLVCGQRGIGSKTMASPPNWETKTAQRLTAMRRPSKVRRHPGASPAKTTLEADLAGAGACIVWSSSSGVKALTLGVPVVYCAPRWIASLAASQGLGGVEKLMRDDTTRLRGLRHMAWGQRSIAEIESGEIFVTMRERIGEAKW